MDWTRQFDAYCERTDLTFWSEPLNAITNLAFLIAAVWMWRQVRTVEARLLTLILFAIGVGSFLFHTYATAWASLADTAPIGIFILVYLFLVNRDVVALRWYWAVAATALFVPYAAILVPILDQIPFLRISNFYWVVPILLFAYGAALRNRQPQVARGLVIGGLILCLSITLRSLDEILCDVFPIGTHIFWHILNGVMLGWMIAVYEFRIRTPYGAVPRSGGA